MSQEFGPGFRYKNIELLNPVERGWRILPSVGVDLDYLQNLPSLPDNVFKNSDPEDEKDEEQGPGIARPGEWYDNAT